MKRIIFIIFTTAALILSSCNREGSQRMVASHGTPYEIVVIATQEKWDAPIGDTLREILLEEVPYLNSREPLFDLMRIVPNNFNGLITKHRNILNLNSGPQFPAPQMTAAYDVYSSPQIIVNITGPDNESVTEYMSEHRYELQTVFSMAERDRAVELAQRHGDRTLEQKTLEKFNFGVKLPKGFKIRNEADNFMWLSYEYPQSSQGLVIYSYPYTDMTDFELDSLFSKRNRFVAQVPGENPGSYMTTYDGITPAVQHLRINGRFWAEMRGFWDVKGDFMGGPFMSYATLDVENRRVVVLDWYVYSPSPYKHKRNFIRQLENLMYTVEFRGDADIRQSEG